MAFFGLFGKKKKDEFGLAGLQESGLRKDELGLPASDYGAPSQPSPYEPSYGAPSVKPDAFRDMQQAQSAGPSVSARDIELLSSKMDTIKALLDNISQRLAIIEKQTQEQRSKEDERKRVGWYG